MQEKIGVIGLGYIGLPLLGALASVGYNVMGVDTNTAKIKHLNTTYEPDIYEPGLSEILKRYRSAITFTDSHEQLMNHCNVIMITVGTPLKKDNTPDLSAIQAVFQKIGKHLRPGHLIILKSTVVPGTTREMARTLEESSGLKAGEDFHIAFFPERTIEGLALHELHTLSKIVGGINPESTERTARIVGKLGGKVIKVSSPEVAEMCKVIDNTYRSINVALANEIGMICEKIGLDAYEVVSAVNAEYARTALARSGLGANGPCLSKDPQILVHFARQKGVDARIVSESIVMNRTATLRVADKVLEFIRRQGLETPTVSFLGLAFKGFPETDDTRDSPTILIKNALEKEIPDMKCQYYDPLITEIFGCPAAPSMAEAIKGANIVLFLTNHPKLTGIPAAELLETTARPLLVVDCWHNIIGPQLITGNGAAIFRIGDGTV
ncbi:MAG: nucleotide sugar dehydrogenase [Chloroflexi bacterium]|nr:nucleotide sugar dehydrogenase [Chloroflexota bacterium]MBI4267563.1 nucleotide sugar dehydrogenase [Chloroflexota bacterium]